MAQDLLVLCEVQDGKVKKTAFELLTKARDLAKSSGGKVAALLVGQSVAGEAAAVAKYGADRVIVIEHEKLQSYSSSAYCKAVVEAIRKVEPSVVLASASPVGKDVMPKVAARLGVGVATECVSVDLQGGRVQARRPMYAGKAIANVSIPKSNPQLVTCRPNSFPVQESAGAGAVEKLDVSFGPEDLVALIKETVKGASGKIDLTEAEIIVSGGRSLGSADNFKILQELADVLGAAVGASRAAVDAGYAGHSMQVGQTGKTVNPKLYIACGISGAIQHLAGMRTSKVIVAINKDPEAPIFKVADYGIVDDLFTVVPLLTKGFRELLSQ